MDPGIHSDSGWIRLPWSPKTLNSFQSTASTNIRENRGIDTRIAQVWYVPAETVVRQLDAVAPCVCINETASVARNCKVLRACARCPARPCIRVMTAAASSGQERERQPLGATTSRRRLAEKTPRIVGRLLELARYELVPGAGGCASPFASCSQGTCSLPVFQLRLL